MGKGLVPVCQIPLAVDLLLFGVVDESTTLLVHQKMERFCKAYGWGEINESKSKLIFSPNTPDDHMVLFKNTLHVEKN